jgi:hypothetical protein
MEKLLKKAKRELAQAGALNIVVGSVLLSVAIPLSILSIVSGAKLLSLRNKL